jgi:transcriptional regulator with GAF, ATPase, and Fis domain
MPPVSCGPTPPLYRTLARLRTLRTGKQRTATPPAAVTTAPPTAQPERDARSDLKSMERTAIERALREAKHNKSKAARALGLTRTQLYVRLRKYGLD